MFEYCLSFSTDSFNSSSVFLSVTVISAPHSAKNSASPIPRPKSPSPMRVILLSDTNSLNADINSLYPQTTCLTNNEAPRSKLRGIWRSRIRENQPNITDIHHDHRS